MIKLWRISNHCDLNGLGGERAGGRWHTAGRGKRIVYLSEHPALALIENLANLKGNLALFPEKFQMLCVQAPEDLAPTFICGENGGVPSLTQPLSWTQKEGDSWLKSRKSAFAVVPSFPSPRSMNYLFNPLHPDAAQVQIIDCLSVEYDNCQFKIRS